MARGVNKVILIGNLGKDPVIRSSTSGMLIATFFLATTDSYKDKSGQWIEQTQWHYITLFNRLAEIARDYLKKGSKIYVEGRLKTEQWTDKEGHERTTTAIIAHELQMLGSRDNTATTPKETVDEEKPEPNEKFDSDIPF